jgi:hypothetical protein
MSPKNILAHIEAKSPAIRCYNCCDSAEDLKLLVSVKNDLNPPATTKSLALLEKHLGKSAKTFTSLYSLHDGFMLYKHSRSRTAGLHCFPVKLWQDKTNEMYEKLEAMGWEDEQYPLWLQKNSLAFGEIPGSANYFVVGTKKPYLGKIFYQMHDDYEEGPLARNFEDFMAMICADPADFLCQPGCHTRYSDGKTTIQWVPKLYLEKECD